MSTHTTARVFVVVSLPGDIVHNVSLQQEFTTRKQVFSDEVLIGPHSYTITHTQRAQNIQHLQPGRTENLPVKPESKFISPMNVSWPLEDTNLVVPSMLVQERDDGLDVILLNDVQNLRAFN